MSEWEGGDEGEMEGGTWTYVTRTVVLIGGAVEARGLPA